jgi:hypothetical protein
MACYGGRIFDQTVTDSTGRFLLEFDRGIVPMIEFIDVYVTTASGARTGARRIKVIELDSPQVVLLKATRNPIALAGGDATGLIRRFTANGEPTLLVDSSCSEILLEWEINGEGDLQILLMAGRHLIAEELQMRGSHVISARNSAGYTLAVRERTRPSTILDRWTVSVKLFPTLSLYFEGTPGLRQLLQVGVAISCPAPDKGLSVTLVSSDHAKLEGGRIVIPSGERWGAVSLAAGALGGEVELTGLAPGYLRDSVRMVIPPA